jgi:homoserine dehydrogenase
VNVAVLGAGAVGAAVLEAAGDHGHRVVAVADSTGAAVDAGGLDPATVLDRKDEDGSVGTAAPEAALDAPYDALVEATPTTLGDAQPGYGHVRAALERDRDVVLANKGPVAERYGDLEALVGDSDGRVLFDAAVGGAVPVVATVERVGPDSVTAVRGVLNGTANFVLSRMAAAGLEYEHVLAEAQDMGVAEADPSFDVQGTDAALKCTILANLLGEEEYTLEDATVEGIEDFPGSALEIAADDGETVRLVGEATPEGARVGPRLVPQESPLAVTGTTNVARVETRTAGPLTLSGRGAGGPETASAVLADLGRLD